MILMGLKNKFIVLLLTFTFVIKMNSSLFAQETQSPAILEYIQLYAPIAIEEMIRTGVPASIKIAQGILETNAGRGDLVMRSNNHFGIKCKTSWTGEKVFHDDDEEGECFRKYASAYDSYVDHSNYLKSQPRYSFLFSYNKDDYASWAWGLKKAGYATNPIYAQTVIKFIEQYRLNQLNSFETIPDGESLKSFLIALNSSSNTAIAVPGSTNQVNEKISGSQKADDANEADKEIIAEKESYPVGIFKVNGLKVIHAKKGTSLLAIAKKYKQQLSNLVYWNELSKNTAILNEDQLIFIQKKRKTGSTQFHIVNAHEDIREISQKEGIQLSSLLKLNKISLGMQPKAGERLSLQIQRKDLPQLIGKHPTHVVKKGESLYTISKKYRVSIDSIKEANSIKNDDLQVGQRLKILK
jgi:LysM repeat protein